MGRRTYDQFCGLAQALDIVGERWTLLLVRDLSLGPQRFRDLAERLSGIGTGLLAERLRHLESEGLVRRTQLPPPAGVQVYELTDDGERLVDSLMPLARWGAGRLPDDRAGLKLHADWLLFSLRAAADPEAAAGVSATYELHADGTVVHVRVDDGEISVHRGPAPRAADVVVRGETEAIVDVGLGRLSLDDAVRSGRLEVEGEPDAVEQGRRILGAAAEVPAAEVPAGPADRRP